MWKPAAAAMTILLSVPPARPVGAFETEMLTATNQLRATVPVPALEWSGKLAEAAHRWADHLISSGRFEHTRHNPYGENLFEARGWEVSATEVVYAWASEAADYDYKTNTCRGTCGHYTQLVWRGTRQVGCAQAVKSSRQVVVCEYNPPGNWDGQKPW